MTMAGEQRWPLGTLERMGYANGSVLEGGINRWTSLGYGSEWGVNVLSKDFGERLQVEQQVPEITAEQLEGWISRGDQFVMVDSRTPEEHHNFCIPGSRSLPGGELALRIWDLMDTEDYPCGSALCGPYPEHRWYGPFAAYGREANLRAAERDDGLAIGWFLTWRMGRVG